MLYRTMGLLHARAWSAASTLREERGQGTVEYVGLMLMLGALLAGVVTLTRSKGGEIGDLVVDQLKDAVEKVGSGK